MSLIKKMKDILFDEEEVLIEKPIVKEEQIKPRATTTYKEVPVVEKIEVPEVKKPVEEITKKMPSAFIDFDEDEFENNMPFVPSEPKKPQVVPTRSQKPVYNEYERKTTVERKVDYGRYEKVESAEIKEKRKFKPSLIISPVYGVLNEDYTPEDIKHMSHDENVLDIDAVRKKAYGEIEQLDIPAPVESVYEKTTRIELKTPYESDEKVKSIDELLQVSADEKIETSSYSKAGFDEFDLTEKVPVVNNRKIDLLDIDEEDTLENDLFDLIDSMYESKEDSI